MTAAAYDQAGADRLGFWETQTRRLQWDKEWHTALEWKPPFAKSFVGGELNVAANGVDRHVAAGNGDRFAIYWEGEPEGDRRIITCAEVHTEVCKAANALIELGVGAGDRVDIAERRELGDVTTLPDPTAVISINDKMERPVLLPRVAPVGLDV